MKFYLILCLTSLAIAQPSVPPDTTQIQQIIEQTRAEFCPDKRLNRFDIESQYGEKIVLQGVTTIAVARDSLLARLHRFTAHSVIDQIRVLPDSSLGEKIYGIIQVSTANMRRKPHVASELINQGIMGEPVRILDKKSFFYFIQLDDGYLGWAMQDWIVPMSLDELETWKKRPKSIYIKNVGTAFSKPSLNADPVSDLVAGAIVVRLEKGPEWTRIEGLSGKEAYVLSAELIDQEDFQTVPNPENLVRTARKFLGLPYFWGGRSPKGFDCSGLIHTVFRLNGLALPRDANMQVNVGKEVTVDSSYQNLQPGDLVFFGRTPERITHVGMVIGDKRFIHSDGFVRFNSFDPNAPDFSDYRVVSLQRVKRIF
ncbi:C40 family peptidase [candidate division KSB1 bacterium]|nr:C40 family peptidase [candidate division KSB1 bacterium]